MPALPTGHFAKLPASPNLRIRVSAVYPSNLQFTYCKLVILYSFKIFKLSPGYSWLVSLIFLGLFRDYWSLPTKSTEKIRRTEGEYLVYDATLADITVTGLVPSKRLRAPKIRKSSKIFVWSWGPLAWNRTREYRRRVWESEMIFVGGWYGVIW